jgi:Ca2+-transporting ATPase
MNSGIESDRLTGLTAVEAARRLAAEGYNELPSARRRSLLTIALGVVREPMFLLLVACGTIYLLLGDVHEALTLLAFVFVVMGITLVQERKTERALEALRDLSSPRALVIRAGEHKRIAGREVVRGDLLVLAEGDRVPADSALLAGTSVSADESLLTGESVPVRKTPAQGTVAAMGSPGGDDLPFLFSGTMVVQGKGVAEVLTTGLSTEIGHVGKAPKSVSEETARVQRETGRVVTRVATIAFALSLIVAVTYALSRGDWLNGFLVGITLAMGILPEELPVVLTIFLGLGAWRIAAKRVLTRRVPAVETLGATTVLCSDKTGTLTHNRMALARLAVGGEVLDVGSLPYREVPEVFHALLEFSMLASHRDPFDPMEQAIHRSALEVLARTEHLHSDWKLVAEYPLSRELLAMSRVWQSPDHERYVIAAKGAPEAIADLCHLAQPNADGLACQVEALASEGLRVLGVARAVFAHTGLPAIQHEFEFEFLGLIGLADPVREAVPEAIREAHAAGIRVVMITGDYPATAMNIAGKIGLPPAGGYLTGSDLNALDDSELRREIGDVNVFCRVAPEQKLRLVEALKANGEIVAMTGDGVNDAPALKAAHIGIAMGGRGTDVAREASAMVLLDDDFSSIVAAVRLGRRIFDNLRKAIAFIIAVHIPIVGMSLIPVALGWSLVLLPVHILFLQLIIDPACSVAFEAEPEETDVMRRPPRSPDERLFDRHTLAFGLVQGLVLLAIVLALYGGALYRGLDAAEARAITFAALVIASVGLIFSNRSRSRTLLATLGTRNPALWWISGGALCFLALVLYVPQLRALFSFGPLHLADLAVCIGAAAVCVVGFEAVKLFRSRGG